MSEVDGRYMAKVFLTQARATKWPDWRSTLVKWARKNLHEWIRERKTPKVGQIDMFGESQ